MVAIEDRLHNFALRVLTRAGALVEWPSAGENGTAIVPEAIAPIVGAGEDQVLPLSCRTSDVGGLLVSVGSNFLDVAEHLLKAESRLGACRADDLYLTRRDPQEALDRAFTWHNAKVVLSGVEEDRAEYHTWWFHAAIASEDRWENCLSVTINAASGAQISFPNPLASLDLEPTLEVMQPLAKTYDQAVRLIQREVCARAGDFMDRMDGRLVRDQRRLRSYYKALLKESTNRRGRQEPIDPDQAAQQDLAVKLELKRKLDELNQRYEMDVFTEPVAVVETSLPVLRLTLRVHRKRSVRDHAVFWNPLIKQLEPIACHHCGQPSYSIGFTNDQVDPVCAACSG